MKDDFKPAQAVQGRVKWFDPSRGFGFVVSDDGGPDILLHANVLRNFGQGSVADGAEIELTVQETPRGLQAVEVVMIAPPPPDESSPLRDIEEADPDVLAQAPLLPARVKWFDKTKGFGFANIFGRAEDVFVHFEVLRRSGLADLAPGEAIAMRVVDGRRGRLAAEITAWEAAPESVAE